ncbi:MAG: hypothetical protein ABI868_21160 [Acidobacteriota bacterium]
MITALGRPDGERGFSQSLWNISHFQEARVMFGAGYRIYFGQIGTSLVLLLVGGTKATQAKDVRRAQDCWQDYLEEK